MKDSIETQIAVVITRLDYVNTRIDEIAKDIKEIKSGYVPMSVFLDNKKDAKVIHDHLCSKDEFEKIKEKVDLIWKGYVTFISIVVVGVITALLSLVVGIKL